MKHKMHYLSGSCLTLLLFLSFLSGCAQSLKPYAAPTLLPGTDRRMLTAGYWISRHPSPDALVLTTEQIAELNRHIEKDLKTVIDITRIPLPYPGSDLAVAMRKDIDRLRARPRYLSSGSRAPGSFYEDLAEYMDLAALSPSVHSDYGQEGYGVVVRFSDQRILPTLEPLYGKPSESDFDSLQNNTLELGTPLLLLHRTRDLNWTYVRSSSSSGWVESRNIARCSQEDLEAFIHPERFVVILRSKADIYRNPALTYSEEYVQMGVRLPLIAAEENAYQVLIPICDSEGYLVRQQGYVQKIQAREGYLPYTARNMLQQAFEMLNAPYGWGGMYGEQDCSRFIQQVFATVGVNFPRNSADQAMVGKQVAEFDPNASEEIKIRSLDRAVGGITTLNMKGHIMLYLGKAGLMPYAIHETWAYRVPDGDQDLTYKINRVAVTDLDLGIGSRNGSLLKRLKSARSVQ
ncbi:MAG: SH3 domain-containing protein [Deltaproteobacteria bacterium]|nr:SH3 domain-containing protein [Deltaproteobacteria bacterium]